MVKATRKVGLSLCDLPGWPQGLVECAVDKLGAKKQTTEWTD